MQTPNYETLIFNKIDNDFMNEWEQLWKNSNTANYINGPQWFKSAIETFGYHDYVMVGVYNSKKLVGVVALIKERIYGINVYTISPGDFASGIPFLTKDENDKAVVKMLTREIVNTGTIVLENIPDYFLNTFVIKEILPSFVPQALNFYLKIKRDQNGQIIVPGRKKLIKEAKTIEKFYSIKSFTGDNQKILNMIFEIDKNSRKQVNGYSTFANTKIKNLYRSLAKNLDNNFIMSLLYFKNKAVAYEIGFLVKNIYTGSQVAYDKRFAKYTPGKVSELKVIDSIASMGVTYMDYGSGDSYIKRLICQDYRQLYQVIISKNYLMNIYLKSLFKLQKTVYSILYSNKLIYSKYRKFKKILIKN